MISDCRKPSDPAISDCRKPSDPTISMSFSPFSSTVFFLLRNRNRLYKCYRVFNGGFLERNHKALSFSWAKIHARYQVFQTFLFSLYIFLSNFFLTATIFKIYLGHTKSLYGAISVSYIMLKEIFFLYRLIVKTKLYISTLFDHYSSNIIIIKFRWELLLCKRN
jgi:hypothetical protein